jgi:hypothetical protein
MKECPICCEKLNKSTRLPIDCKGCDQKEYVCRTCAQTFILNSNENPKCMICKCDWDREFMCDNLTKVFVEGKLKEHTENIRVEDEISRLAETQVYANARKQAASIDTQVIAAQKVIDIYYIKIEKQRRLIREFERTKTQLLNGDIDISFNKTNFTYKCLKENCKGFLDPSFKCGLCDSTFCKKCMVEIKDEDHECNKDDVETFKTIKKDTKPCPSCGEMIFKIDGCDQMWCVACHTSFSWRTGTISTSGANHNPEYFRWLRENGQTIARNPLDIVRGECGQEINDITLNHHIRSMYIKPFDHLSSGLNPDALLKFAFGIYRFKSHLETYAGRITDYEPQLREYRIRYLLDQISKDEWKKNIQIIDKKKTKEDAQRNVWLLVQTVLTEIINRLFALKQGRMPQEHDIFPLILESENVRKHANDSFIKISKNYTNCSMPGITNTWREVNNIRTHIKVYPDHIEYKFPPKPKYGVGFY